jgi:DNA-binding transcriptional ArsR family regulator
MLEIDDLIHQPSRLRIMAALAAVPDGEPVDFVSLKEITALTDGNISAHSSVFEQNGYILVDKGYEGKEPKTYIRINSSGRGAFMKYVSGTGKFDKGLASAGIDAGHKKRHIR